MQHLSPTRNDYLLGMVVHEANNLWSICSSRDRRKRIVARQVEPVLCRLTILLYALSILCAVSEWSIPVLIPRKSSNLMMSTKESNRE